MVTLILPGYSAKNKDWALDVAKNLKVNHEIRPILWEHWTDPEKTFKPKEKAQDVIDVLLKANANIIAKSVGTFVSALVVEKIPDRINKVILCGIPAVSDEKLKIFKVAFGSFPSENVICFQNTKDPWATYEEVKEFMSKVNPKIRVIEKPCSDHNYPYFSDFQAFLSTS
ncbi:hypothetical protein A2361_00235 [Candidatus Woesebacteria bacterium RIFOXYB1_FULL_40_26]|uniref:AB hydrolase-1 domain-containing protein n=2 Tax=Candidatus Woeseibacteriota TaxID=1752722 RepID=A0A1F8DK93_9BACT|nr:MAG: hypothetical protein A2361_00235 [Candidatus Woesebacteria bacterium RIFOXYB1_FULL_40_26]OGM88429.1 MAG: hypothetical protein A2614_01975 [Candidatus Woesebacteria bacterium RIFOXYD1_FULL_40_21]